jgi:hypothetical protein
VAVGPSARLNPGSQTRAQLSLAHPVQAGKHLRVAAHGQA